MNSFVRMLDADVHDVFLDPAEFGELAELAGHPDIPVVLEPLELEFPGAADTREGVGFEGVTLYVASADVPDMLLPGRVTTFRDERWHVLGSDRQGQIRKIELYRERTWASR